MSDAPLATAVERLLLPLVVGGELRPLPPIGAKRALEHAHVCAALPDFSGGAQNEIQWQRLRVARRLCPIDRLPAPSSAEWLLAFALNDLLQATNPDLPGVLARDRPSTLIDLAAETIALAGAPANVADAIGRHATFSRLLELVRIDTHVSWWVGSRSYRGAEPPGRLTAWKSLRRVREQRQNVELAAMADSASWGDSWRATLGRLIAASPLTDLTTAARNAPEFGWTGASLGLLGTAPGRTLAKRSLGLAGARALSAAVRATEKLSEIEPRAVGAARAFLAELAPASSKARA